MQTVNDPDLIKAYHSRLGEISLKKLGDREQAAHHFKVALRLGQVEPQAFRFLKEYLYAEHDFRSLAECLKIRIELSDGRERVELLQELFRLPEGVSDDQLDV